MSLPLPIDSKQLPFNRFHGAVKDFIHDARNPDAVLNIGQRKALAALEKHFAPVPRGQPSKPDTAIVVLPTGAGKSGVAALAPYMLNQSKVLVITPSVIITRQLADAFWGEVGAPFYLQCGLIRADEAASFTYRGKMVTKSLSLPNNTRDENIQEITQQFSQTALAIVNCQKFRTPSQQQLLQAESCVTIDELKDIHEMFDLVIVNEAHHYPAPTWSYIIDKFTKCKKIFLTATPRNKDKPILGDTFEGANPRLHCL